MTAELTRDATMGNENWEDEECIENKLYEAANMKIQNCKWCGISNGRRIQNLANS